MIPDDIWRRARGNQIYRERKFVQSGKERERLIALGFIKPRNTLQEGNKQCTNYTSTGR